MSFQQAEIEQPGLSVHYSALSLFLIPFLLWVMLP
ncbi:hypothetical protein KPNJ1_03975 [Klebsiella pneumoniae 30660/NJST258_1]|uniref:Uncharacterized protein n=1 Tax=Klebsiella pneumoniae 30684/NJST258_2 TaxID=1420013 RepID=W8ULN2_KLEPN|nr:hypothetical protein KPNJ2_04019 [Klebsiella pneumoniae 30684/NJST258_2]AHM86381.1 hypothetical protein KPNJ1_03975 [Klebsiella pneumoniae 30660/NJST258_1]BAH62307.1 hypothetical protein KP1_1554 [Klebsiella pneumoniae subsp. pneumoniae NTUH-K2044]